MMTTQKIDSERARDAFEELRSRLDQQTELRRVNVDVEKAATQAAGIGRMVQQADIRAMFAILPAQVFDMRHVDVLERAAMAAWYAVVEHRDAAVNMTRARVPADTVADASQLKQRMLMVLEYNLRDDGVAALLADIRAGQGHADTASDLLRLSKQYEIHETELAVDRVHYRRDDADRASELAHRIHAHLAGRAESEERVWADYVQRAWTYLLDTYDEVSATGRWLYRHDKGDERFPSLIAPWRQYGSRSGSAQPEAGSAADSNADSAAEPAAASAADISAEA